MFKKLRNKLIWINLGITSMVILIVFSAIYVFATRSAEQRPPMNAEKIEFYPDDVENLVQISIANERKSAAQNLLMTLVMSGVAIELVVAFISYFLAEEAVKPVREAYDSQKVFIANASHEIKTPLAAISANLEAADIKGNKWISNVEKETAKLTALNNELLDLARTDLVKESKIEEVNLGDLINKLTDGFEPRLDGIRFKKEGLARGKVKLAVADFSQIFGILMDNAIKYCDKKIILKITNHELIISNDGAKIPENDLAHVFERFYQTDKTSEGVGLGLSIAKSIAERNGWDLSALSEKLTTFTLKF